MASARDIRRRIKGVKSTGKITRAMEMISAVKMRKAVQPALDIRPYAHGAIAILSQLSRLTRQEQHPLLADRPVVSELFVVVASNRGLCGAFNAQIGRKLRTLMKENTDRKRSFITIGNKADAMVRRIGGDILASFPDVLGAPSPEMMRPIVRLAVDEFKSGRADRIEMLYTDYISVMLQRVGTRTLLPFAMEDAGDTMRDMGIGGRTGESVPIAEYVIEPSPNKVLEQMIYRLLEMELYHGVLESNASQESARMMAMKSATDAAKEMTADLTLAYNQVRQSKITQEIAELSAGKAALEG